MDPEVYRVDWHFPRYRVIPLGEVRSMLEKEGFNLNDRDRLRPLYALRLQQEFGAHLFRVGPPIMPPMHRKLRGKIFRTVEGKEELEVLEDNGIIASYFKGQHAVRITPSIAGQLEICARALLSELEDELRRLNEAAEEGNGMARRRDILGRRVGAMARHLNDEMRWIALLGDCGLPAKNDRKSLMNGLHLAYGGGWAAPNEEAIVLEVTEIE